MPYPPYYPRGPLYELLAMGLLKRSVPKNSQCTAPLVCGPSASLLGGKRADSLQSTTATFYKVEKLPYLCL